MAVSASKDNAGFRFNKAPEAIAAGAHRNRTLGRGMMPITSEQT
jgi:hypothetical protein